MLQPKEKDMTNEEYYAVIDMMIPSYGPAPLDLKKELVELAKVNPSATLYPATQKEIDLILEYLNKRGTEIDLFAGNPGFCVYKDVSFCVSPDRTHWELHDKDPDRLCWAMLEYLRHREASFEDAAELNLANIYTLK